MKTTTIRKVAAKEARARRAKAAPLVKKAKKQTTKKVTKVLRKVHRGYVVRDGCHNCAKSFENHIFDDDTELYCHRDANKVARPASGNPKRYEAFSSEKFKSRKYPDGPPQTRVGNDERLTAEYEDYLKQFKRWRKAQQKKWDAWADLRRVHACGFCPQHKLVEEAQ